MSENYLYFGEVSHERFTGTPHRLAYRIAYAYVDVDALHGAKSPTRLFGFGRPALLCVLAKDHGEGGPDLGLWVRRFLKSRGVERPAARIMLLTLPRMLGCCFNPVSFYFIHDGEDRLFQILCEVNNTFGGRHFYLLAGGEDVAACEKGFYVSPFFETSGGYEFRFRPPADTMAVNILYRDKEGRRALTARLSGERQPLDRRRCLQILFGLPFMTIGVIFAIHLEALKLLLKGVRYHPLKETS